MTDFDKYIESIGGKVEYVHDEVLITLPKTITNNFNHCSSLDCVNKNTKECYSCKKFYKSSEFDDNYAAYKPTCPQGYGDCQYDPAYMKCYQPKEYEKQFGNLTPEEASKQVCSKDNYCYS